MFTSVDKMLAALLGAALPWLFAQLGPAPDALVQYADPIQVALAAFLAWLVPNKVKAAK